MNKRATQKYCCSKFAYNAQTASNFYIIFEKLSECFMRLQVDCPRFLEYQKLFRDSVRLRKSLCSLYATVIRFCTNALGALQRPGMSSMWFEKRLSDVLGLQMEKTTASQLICHSCQPSPQILLSTENLAVSKLKYIELEISQLARSF